MPLRQKIILGNIDPYLDKNGVLKNFNIANSDRFKQAESDLAKARPYCLEQNSVKGDLNLKYLKAIHKQLFG